MISID